MHLIESLHLFRPTRKRFVGLFLGLGIALTHAQVFADAAALDKSSIQDKATVTLVELPHTDGYGLLPKPPSVHSRPAENSERKDENRGS